MPLKCDRIISKIRQRLSPHRREWIRKFLNKGASKNRFFSAKLFLFTILSLAKKPYESFVVIFFDIQFEFRFPWHLWRQYKSLPRTKNASLNRESLKRYPRNSINLAYLYSSCSLTRLLSRSPEWTNISDKEKEKLGLTFEDDGDFW